MAKIVLSNVVSGYNPATINANFQAIAQHLNDKVLYRDNPTGEPNQIVQQTVDMNNKRLINLPAPTSDTEPMRRGDIGNLANDVADAKAAAIAAGNSAIAAAASATAASGSANSAAGSSTSAGTFANQAGVYRNEALTYRNQAEQYSIAAYDNSRLSVGTVTTGAAGSSASVTINGNPGTQTISFVIPRGDTGATGPQGPVGPLGPSGDGTGDVVGEATTVIGNVAVWGNVDGKYIVDDGLAVSDIERKSEKGQANGYAPLDSNSKIPDQYLNLAPEVVAPTNLVPGEGTTGMNETPHFEVSGFFSSYGATHQNTQIQISLVSDFSSTVYSQNIGAVTQYDMPAGILLQDNTYYWRVRFQNSRGTWSAYSTPTSFSTALTFYNYIPTPQATPAAGAAFEGGFYSGAMMWHEQAQSATSHTIGVGQKVFTVPDQAITPIVYGGQVITVRSRANPNNSMTGTVSSAVGTTLALNITSVSGSGTFSDWSIMARYRIIVAPKASRPTGTYSCPAQGSFTPKYLAHGHLNTSTRRSASSPATDPVAWVSNISAGGFSDWYTPSVEEVYSLLALLKSYPNNNTASSGGWSTNSSAGHGEINGSDSRVNGTTLNSAPPFSVTSTTVPGVTSVSIFATGGSEEIVGGPTQGALCTSTGSITVGVGTSTSPYQSFYTSTNGNTSTATAIYGRVLPIRRSII